MTHAHLVELLVDLIVVLIVLGSARPTVETHLDELDHERAVCERKELGVLLLANILAW